MMTKKVGASQKLLLAAEAELIANHGHMEMSAVAKRAGVSVGLAYHHFGSKTGLVAAVVDRFYGPLREISFGNTISLDLEWRVREKTRTAAMIDYFYAHPLAPLISGRLAREPEVLDIERAHSEALLEAGARNIAQGQKQGVVDKALDPAVTVAMLMGGIRLAIDQAILMEQRPSRDLLLDQLWRLTASALQLANSDSIEVHTDTGDRHASNGNR